MSNENEVVNAQTQLYDDDGFREKSEAERTAIQNHWLAIKWRKFTYFYSMLLLIFSLVVIVYGIGKQWTNPPWKPKDSHPAVDIIAFFAMLTWISLLEGAQISLVGLQNVDMEKYKKSHPRAYKCCKWIHQGANVEKFLVGRQFLLLFNGFLVSRVGSGKYEDYHMGSWNWNDETTDFFWLNSTLLMVVIIALAQLPSQLLAADKMMGFLDLRFAACYWTVVWPCMIVEFIGLTHATYLLKDFLAWAVGIDQNEGNPEKRMTKNFFYYLRCFISVAAVLFSAVFIGKGIAMGQTGATQGNGWKNLPGGVALAVSIFIVFIIACSEGVQVSALALAGTRTSDFRKQSPLAYRTTQLLYAGRNMQAFLVGRQFFVAMTIVLLAKVTGYAGEDGILVNNKSDWGMGKGFNEGLLQTGFLGAIFVVNVGQLASQVLASVFPIAFINNHFINWILRIMLFVEFLGVVNACWPLTWFLDMVSGLPKDPIHGDESVDTPANQILDRKKSLGIPVAKGTTPFDLDQPEQEYHVDYTYKVSYI